MSKFKRRPSLNGRPRTRRNWCDRVALSWPKVKVIQRIPKSYPTTTTARIPRWAESTSRKESAHFTARVRRPSIRVTASSATRTAIGGAAQPIERTRQKATKSTTNDSRVCVKNPRYVVSSHTQQIPAIERGMPLKKKYGPARGGPARWNKFHFYLTSENKTGEKGC